APIGARSARGPIGVCQPARLAEAPRPPPFITFLCWRNAKPSRDRRMHGPAFCLIGEPTGLRRPSSHPRRHRTVGPFCYRLSPRALKKKPASGENAGGEGEEGLTKSNPPPAEIRLRLFDNGAN